jgi:hypothetical protein
MLNISAGGKVQQKSPFDPPVEGAFLTQGS